MENQEKPQNAPLAYQFRPWCKMIGISPSTGYSLVRRGRIRLTKIGKRSVVTAAESARILAEGV